MGRFCDGWKQGLPALLLFCAFVLTCGCAMMARHQKELPPLLAQDELLRPHQTIATIEVHRGSFGSSWELTPADYNWAHRALREEAEKIGAEAVVLSEIRVEQQQYIIFPSSEIRAKGIAIKFR